MVGDICPLSNNFIYNWRTRKKAPYIFLCWTGVTCWFLCVFFFLLHFGWSSSLIKSGTIGNCNWQDTPIFGCWFDVDWSKGWKIFHATCLPRFWWAQHVWLDTSQWKGLWTSGADWPWHDLGYKFLEIQGGRQWLWRRLDGSNWCEKWEVNILTFCYNGVLFVVLLLKTCSECTKVTLWNFVLMTSIDTFWLVYHRYRDKC